MMLKRIKRLWKLSKKDEQVMNLFDDLTDEDIESIPDAPDGKAVFLGEGTQEEYLEQERKDSGMSGWYRRIRNL